MRFRALGTLLLIIGATAVASFLGFVTISAYNAIQRGGVPSTPKITWTDVNGTVITSVTLTFSVPGSASATVAFTCSPATGSVQLDLSTNLFSIVTLPVADFSSCSSISNSVRLTASATGGLPISGNIRVREPSNYRTLAPPLQITVRAG